ncbi:MAG TPA: prolipoprotein diacylglyceryl transferase [Anaeromyxobacteraceae bacterium]|nr:prolipoprotein diacylglyceryl transferase [Anaeromyxobacteraceae bacterium]
MLPVLYQIPVPASLAKPLVVALAVAIVGVRAFVFRRRARAAGEPVSFAQALWGDKVTVAVLALAAAGLWRAGYLDQDLRIPLHTYGLLLAMGFVIAIWVAQREARRQGQDAEAIGDLSFWILVAALVGSRVYYILVNWNDYFGQNALVVTRLGRIPRLLAVWEGGLVFYGGFIASVLTAWWYMRRRNMPFLAYADTMIPSVALGHFFGRLGCFSAGCCWGQVSHAHVPWLAEFPPESLAYQSFAARADPSKYLAPDRLHTLPLHPTQLYEASGELLLFFVLVALIRPRKRFHGQVLATWLMAYAVLRTVVETFRGDVERRVVAGWGVGAWTSIAIFAAGVAIFAAGRRRAAAAAT